mgnify:CR=1 FL=1
MAYYTSNAEHPIDILNIKGLEARVKARMEPGAFGYIREGAEDEWTLRENTRSFEDRHIVPRVLRGISHADLSTSISEFLFLLRSLKLLPPPMDLPM